MKNIKEFYTEHREVINYFVYGGLTTLVSLGVYYSLTLTILNPLNPIQLQIANNVSWISAVSFAYITNRQFVFNSHCENLVKEASYFFLGRVGTLLIDMSIMFILVTLAGINDKIVKLAVQVVITITNYLISKFLVFRNKE